MVDKFPSKRRIDTPTLKWMRHLIPHSSITNTLTDMLIKRESNPPFFIRLLQDSDLLSMELTKSQNQFNFDKIKLLRPELLFHKDTLNKIYKIRDIFLRFDFDRSRTLEIEELYAMFNSNNIPIKKGELIELFTEENQKKKKRWQYKLTFLDLVDFALNEECQKKFRNLMNKIKNRNPNISYLPLSLEQALEYIFNKGQINVKIKTIYKEIKKMQKTEKFVSNSELARRESILKKLGISSGVNVHNVLNSFGEVVKISKEQFNILNKNINKNHFNEKEARCFFKLHTQYSNFSAYEEQKKKMRKRGRNNSSFIGKSFCSMRKGTRKLPSIFSSNSNLECYSSNENKTKSEFNKTDIKRIQTATNVEPIKLISKTPSYSFNFKKIHKLIKVTC